MANNNNIYFITVKNLLSAAAGLLLCCTVAAQNFAVATNVLDYVDLGTLNLEASCGIARHWSLLAGIKYNPFHYGEGSAEVADCQRSVEAGARFWPWHIYSGWWLAGKLKWQEYNQGGLVSPQASEGDRYGGSLGAGYTFMLNTHLNLDVGFGLWSGYDKFTRYECLHCGRVIESGEKIFVLPNDILLTLSFIF